LLFSKKNDAAAHEPAIAVGTHYKSRVCAVLAGAYDLGVAANKTYKLSRMRVDEHGRFVHVVNGGVLVRFVQGVNCLPKFLHQLRRACRADTARRMVQGANVCSPAVREAA